MCVCQLICGDLNGNTVLVGNASSKAEFCFEAVSLERDPLNKMGYVCSHGVLCGWRYGWLVFLCLSYPISQSDCLRKSVCAAAFPDLCGNYQGLSVRRNGDGRHLHLSRGSPPCFPKQQQ